MDVRYVTDAGTPGRPNEDYVVCGPDWIGVFDGASRHPEIQETCCVHDVRWLVRQVAGAVAGRMPLTSMPLDDLLANAIKDVRERHGGTCDLDHPDSPATTVSLCRVNDTTVEYLALADSPIVVLDPAGGAQVYTDDALTHLPGGRPYTRDLVRRHRNQPGGFWVASTVPEAAYHAVRGQAELVHGSEVAVLTDGVSRITDEYGYSWESVFGLLRDSGPRQLIDRVRELETQAPPKCGKVHDDATVAYARSLAAW